MSVCVSFHELIKSSSKFHNIYKNTLAGACLIACNMQAAKMAVAWQPMEHNDYKQGDDEMDG